jgi:hypothetical protein
MAEPTGFTKVQEAFLKAELAAHGFKKDFSLSDNIVSARDGTNREIQVSSAGGAIIYTDGKGVGNSTQGGPSAEERQITGDYAKFNASHAKAAADNLVEMVAGALLVGKPTGPSPATKAEATEGMTRLTAMAAGALGIGEPTGLFTSDHVTSHGPALDTPGGSETSQVKTK